MMEALRSSETSVLTRATRCHIPVDGIIHSHRRENLYLTKLSLLRTSCFAFYLRIGDGVDSLGDRLYGLMLGLPGCRPRSPEFDSRRCQIF
jgi:hypothetical protein